MSLTGLAEHVQRKRRLPPPEVAEMIRRTAGLSRAELAQHLGVTTQALFYWEKGKRTPRADNRDRYAAALEILRGAGS